MSALEPDPPPDPSADPLLGAVLSGRYRVVETLGVGGMGTVYRGEHVALPRRVAIKVLHPELSALPEARGRFEREAHASAVLDHPNVVSVTDVGTTPDGRIYLVMEFIEGATLRAALDAAGTLELPRLANLARQLGAALERAHAQGIVHRDLKPENIMLVPRDGEAELVKVVDFGIAKISPAKRSASDSVQTRVGLVYGTFEYMPPEQALGAEVDASADIYALGVILFEALTGRRPFEDESAVNVLSRQLSEPVPSASARRPGGAPREVDRVLDAMMARAPEARPPSVRAAVDAFLAALQRPSVIAGPPAAQPSPPSRALPPLALAGGVAALGLVVGLGWWFGRSSPARPIQTRIASDVPVVHIAPDAPAVRPDAGGRVVRALSAPERARRYLALPQTQEGFRRARGGEYPAVARAFAHVWRGSGDPTVAWALGVLASQCGRHDDAVTWFERAARAEPSLATGEAVDALRAARERGSARAARLLASPPFRR